MGAEDLGPRCVNPSYYQYDGSYQLNKRVIIANSSEKDTKNFLNVKMYIKIHSKNQFWCIFVCVDFKENNRYDILQKGKFSTKGESDDRSLDTDFSVFRTFPSY